jgi:hypothetical protein
LAWMHRNVCDGRRGRCDGLLEVVRAKPGGVEATGA